MADNFEFSFIHCGGNGEFNSRMISIEMVH